MQFLKSPMLRKFWWEKSDLKLVGFLLLIATTWRWGFILPAQVCHVTDQTGWYLGSKNHEQTVCLIYRNLKLVVSIIQIHIHHHYTLFVHALSVVKQCVCLNEGFFVFVYCVFVCWAGFHNEVWNCIWSDYIVWLQCTLAANKVAQYEVL